MNEQILKAVEKLGESVENLREDTNKRFETLTRETNQRIETLTREVSWIRGKLEGRDESKSENRVNLALGMAGVSALVAFAALFKGCF